jgi:hypothetical protein
MGTQSETRATFLKELQQRLQPLQRQVAHHPLYASIRTMEDLHLFMQSHVFAVWDFMSLLKSLQRGLTSVDVPWLPMPQPEARRLINEIVLGEESDLYQGRAVSHFELYLEAMRQCGASTAAIDSLLAQVRSGIPVGDALRAAPEGARSFVLHTFSLVEQQQLHKIAAAFTFGREDVIPEMFRGFVRSMDEKLAGRLSTFLWYLERHIEVDGEEHGPMALRMVAELCGEDAVRWREAGDAAEDALRARLMLLDAILTGIALEANAVRA